MQPLLLVNKLFAENKTTTKFLEKYYSDRIGSDITIHLTNSGTSYFKSPKVFISRQNLAEFINYNQKLFRPLFYTLLLHEIGHAIYTGELPYSESLNVLEDNRLEHQISLWNARVRFKLMRYLYQDKKIKKELERYPEQLFRNKLLIKLCLLRTIDNTMYVNALGSTMKRKEIVKQILLLNDIYMKKDYELSRTNNSTHINELEDYGRQLDVWVDKLITLYQEEQQQKQQQKGNEKQQEQQQQEQEQQEQQQQQAKAQENKEDNINDIENELTSLMQEAERMQLDPEYNTPILHNQWGDRIPYTKYKIGLFDTARHSGIKNTSNTQASRGNIKQLNMQRYMRRHIVRGEKLFDKQSFYGSGGKGAKLCFYLDISGSMTESIDGTRNTSSKLRVASDYLKSFYDTMHKRIDIRMFGFGRYTYKITRNELNYMFLRNNLEGSTRIQDTRPRPREITIVLTDGIIHNDLSDYMKQNAYFVMIEPVFVNSNHKRNYRERSRDYKHRIFVKSDNIVKGLEQATQKIRSVLLK